MLACVNCLGPGPLAATPRLPARVTPLDTPGQLRGEPFNGLSLSRERGVDPHGEARPPQADGGSPGASPSQKLIVASAVRTIVKWWSCHPPSPLLPLPTACLGTPREMFLAKWDRSDSKWGGA